MSKRNVDVSAVVRSMAAGSFAVVALALGVVPAQAASPGEPVDGRGAECSFGCIEIQNRSHRKVLVSRDWCGDDPAGAVKKKTWICGKPSDKHPYQYLEPGEHSYGSAYHDTDSFRIDPGYEMHVQWNNDGEEDGPVTVYEKKGYTRWVKVANNHDIDIEAYFKP